MVEPKVIRDSPNIMEVELENVTVQKTVAELFIGCAAIQHIRQEHLHGTAVLKTFYSEVRGFYMSTLKYMKRKFPLKDSLIKNATVVDPTRQQDVSLKALIELTELLPGIIPENNMESLLSEFCQHQAANSSDLPNSEKLERIEVFWEVVSQIKVPTNGKEQYPNLCKLAKHVLLIPHSNAYCETLFSQVKKVTTDSRSQLGRGKEGNAKSSVYSEHHNITNTLCAILNSKINIFKETCYTWKPSEQLLKKAKSATYNVISFASKNTST